MKTVTIVLSDERAAELEAADPEGRSVEEIYVAREATEIFEGCPQGPAGQVQSVDRSHTGGDHRHSPSGAAAGVQVAPTLIQEA